jgi:hypothetical protein
LEYFPDEASSALYALLQFPQPFINNTPLI